MTTLRAAAQQALETMLSWQEMIEREWGCGYSNEKLDALGMTDPAITALKAALEQQGEEPVAVCEYCEKERPVIHPPRREWRGLTDVEVEELQSGMQASHKDICAIEAALKEKNK
jgi:hypothetical protein